MGTREVKSRELDQNGVILWGLAAGHFEVNKATDSD